MDKQKQQSEIIEMMRLPLTILVVFAHMLPFNSQTVPIPHDSQTWYIFTTEIISHGLGALTISSFFIFSGYFFFGKFQSWDWHKYRNSLRQKGKTLLFPYIFWNIAIVAAMLIINYIGEIIGSNREQGAMPAIYDIFWGQPANFPLWYVRDLMCMMLISPLFFVLLKRGGRWGILLLMAWYISGYYIPLTGFGSTAIFFFGVGAYFSIYRQNMISFAEKFRVISWLIAPCLLIASTLGGGYEWGGYVSRLFVIVGIVATFNVFHRLHKNYKLRLWLIKWSAPAFFIYVAHEIYIINWLKGGLARLPLSEGSPLRLIAFCITPFVCTAICILLYKFFNRFTPRALAITTGGRISSNINPS